MVALATQHVQYGYRRVDGLAHNGGLEREPGANRAPGAGEGLSSGATTCLSEMSGVQIGAVRLSDRLR